MYHYSPLVDLCKEQNSRADGQTLDARIKSTPAEHREVTYTQVNKKMKSLAGVKY
jgi:hypothetical protein